MPAKASSHPSSKPPISRKSLFWQTLFVVTLLITARLLWTNYQPERLTTIVVENYRISDDHLYGLFSPATSRRIDINPWGMSYDSSQYGIQVQSIHAPTLRTLVSNDTDYPFRQPYTLGIAGGNLYYAVRPRRTSKPNLEQGPFGSTFFLPPKNASATQALGLTRTQHNQYPPTAEEVRFREVSTQGGEPREAAVLHGSSFCLIGSHVFWIRPKKEETAKVNQGQVSWRETTAHSDLMLTSLADGSTRCIHHGIYRYTPLTIQETGITWTQLAPYPQKPTLFYARAADGVVRPLSMIDEENPQSLREFGGRLYWTINTAPTEGYANSRQVLRSSNPDGTDVREVLTEIQNHPIAYILLYPYQNSLYCFLRVARQTSNGRGQAFLCRLHLDQPDPLEILRKLPSGTRFAQFDEGYLYGVLNERRRSLLGSLLDDDLDQSFTTTLCRIPLEP